MESPLSLFRNIKKSSISDLPVDPDQNFTKAKSPEDKLLSLYETIFADVASRYESGGLDWLAKNWPGLYAAIERAEDNLNNIWDQCLKGRSSTDNFNAALCQWHKTQVRGIEKYTGRADTRKAVIDN